MLLLSKRPPPRHVSGNSFVIHQGTGECSEHSYLGLFQANHLCDPCDQFLGDDIRVACWLFSRLIGLKHIASIHVDV